jgi:hypothetical protein
MNLDAADLAGLEVDIENLEPLGRDVAKMLIEHIRGMEDDVETANKRVETAIDNAKDAAIYLKQLRHLLDEHTELPHGVDVKADELEEALDKITEGLEE